MVRGTAACCWFLSALVDDDEEEGEEKSSVSSSCRSGSQPTLFHVVHAVAPPGFRVRCSSRTPWAGEGKAKSARAVKERSNVSRGNDRDVESMSAVSMLSFGLAAAAAAGGVVVVVVREESRVWL